MLTVASCRLSDICSIRAMIAKIVRSQADLSIAKKFEFYRSFLLGPKLISRSRQRFAASDDHLDWQPASVLAPQYDRIAVMSDLWCNHEQESPQVAS
jgi:hypothetical protein